MAIGKIALAVTAISKVLLKILNLIDPKSRDFVHKRKALEWAEKFILTYYEIERIKSVRPFTETEEKLLDKLQRKLGRYKEWFFQYN